MNNEIKARMDAWTPIEEEILMKIALRYVRDGRTLREAFEQASYRIERTTSACQYRFNSTLLKVPFNQERYAKAKAIARDNKYRESKAMREGFAESYENAFKRPVFENVPEEIVGSLLPVIDGESDTRYLKPKEEPKALERDIDAEISNNPIYSSVLDVMIKAQRRQVAYGLDKYVESLNVDSWSTIETLDHIISETVDQLHYLSMLKMKVLANLQ